MCRANSGSDEYVVKDIGDATTRLETINGSDWSAYSHGQFANRSTAFMRAAEVGGVTPELRKRFADMKSSMRSALNGIELNRAKYTSFSRHYTSARVLREIANVLQPLLQANGGVPLNPQ